jgi:hypothetical protein
LRSASEELLRLPSRQLASGRVGSEGLRDRRVRETRRSAGQWCRVERLEHPLGRLVAGIGKRLKSLFDSRRNLALKHAEGIVRGAGLPIVLHHRGGHREGKEHRIEI